MCWRKEQDLQTDPLSAYCLYPNQAATEINRAGVKLLSPDASVGLLALI